MLKTQLKFSIQLTAVLLFAVSAAASTGTGKEVLEMADQPWEVRGASHQIPEGADPNTALVAQGAASGDVYCKPCLIKAYEERLASYSTFQRTGAGGTGGDTGIEGNR